jgi:hypothetical protein
MNVTYGKNAAKDSIRYSTFVKTVDIQIEGIANQIRLTSITITDLENVFDEFSKKGGKMRRFPLPKVLDLYTVLSGCSDTFHEINTYIYLAVKNLPSPSDGKAIREKKELEPEERQALMGRLNNAEKTIDFYRWKLGISLTTFSMRINNQ